MIRLEPGWARCISARLDASIGAPGPHDFAVRDRPRQRSCRASCRPASSGKDGWQRRSSARRPIAHEKTRPAIPLRARRCRVPRIPPRVRDDSRSAPFSGGTGRACRGDLPDALSGIFLSTGLDRFLVVCPPGYFPSSFVRQKSLCRLAMLHLRFSRSFASCANRINPTGLMMSVDGGRPEVAGKDLNGAFDPERTSRPYGTIIVKIMLCLKPAG
jgi:hypothetical protein